MKIRRKVTHCLNCNAMLDEVYNFCPMCGQENNDNNVSVGTLIHDFFSNYFAFDSKLTKTVIPFFTKPGYITNRYFEGKRVSYAHPLRMYLIISLFYFFIWSLLAKDLVQETQGPPLTIEEAAEAGETFEALDSTARASIRGNLSEESLRKMDSALAANDSLGFMNAFRKYSSPSERQEIANFLTQEVLDTTITQLPKETSVNVPEINLADSIDQDTTDQNEFILFRIDYEKLNELGKDRTLTDQQILDSLDMGELKGMEANLTRQVIRVNRADKEALAGYIVKNLPIMMLFLIPIFAAILKLLYIRRPFLYFNHIIHGLHLHSFAYLIYGITLIFSYFIITDEDWPTTINFFSFIGVTTYAYLSFLRVYKQGWFKTLVKFNLTGFIYMCLIAMFFSLELLLSFYLY